MLFVETTYTGTAIIYIGRRKNAHLSQFHKYSSLLENALENKTSHTEIISWYPPPLLDHIGHQLLLLNGSVIQD